MKKKNSILKTRINVPYNQVRREVERIIKERAYGKPKKSA